MSRYLFAVFVSVYLNSLGLAQQQVKPTATYKGHVASASAVAFSPDGKLLASGSDDQSIILWELAQGKPRFVLEGHRCSVWNLAFSPDGKLLASGIGQPSSERPSGWDFTIKLWDVNTGTLRRSLEGCSSNVFSMAFSPDGKYLAACHNFGIDNVKLWDLTSGKLLGSPTRGGHGASLVFSHDGKLLAVADGEKGVELWELSTSKRKVKFGLSANGTGGVSFSPDDKMLAVGTTESVTLCDVNAGKEIRTLDKATFFPKEVLFSPNGKHLVAAASDFRSVRMWDVQSGKELIKFEPAASEDGNIGADGIAFSHDGTLVAAANRNSMVTVWRNPLSKLPPPAVKSGVRDATKAAPAPRASHKERDSDLQWFGAFFQPDAKDYPFVKVYTNTFEGRFHFESSFGTDESKESIEVSPERQKTLHGFLLEKKDNRFTVLTTELVRATFEIDPKAEVKDKAVRFEPADLKAYAAGILKDLRAPRKDAGRQSEMASSLRLQAFALAWTCWRHKLDDLAADLHHEAAQMPAAGDQLSPRPLRAVLSDELADTAVDWVLARYNRKEVTRAEMLQELEEKAKRWPEFSSHDDVRVLVPLLRKMVQEDAEHAKNAGAKLSQREQIAKLIFQLRDQSGFVPPSNFVNRSDPFKDPVDDRIDHDPWPDAPNSPAQQLVKLGLAAAEQLIEALDDDRLTRSMVPPQFGRHHTTSSCDVLRVGDCAVLILERISGRKFLGVLPAATKQRILAWHREIRENGEKQTLIDGVCRGDEQSYEQALLLIAKHPTESLPPIEAGLKAVKDEEIRNWLLRAAGRLEGCEPLLLVELKDGPSPSGRLEAAKILHRKGRPEAIAGMIALWQTELAQKEEDQDYKQVRHLTDVAETLIATQQSKAIDAVALGLQKRPVGLRQEVIGFCSWALAPWNGDFVNPKRVESKVPAEARMALERILLALLDDTEEVPRQFPATRNCDRAATAFNEISTTLYPFNANASVEARNESIREIKRVWHKMHDNAEGER